MEIIFMNMENNKMNEPHKFVHKLVIKIRLMSSANKHGSLQNLSIYYTLNNIRKQY